MQTTMESAVRERSYVVPGWMAICAGVVSLPLFFLQMISGIAEGGLSILLLPLELTLGLLWAFLWLYALYRFKDLLNERFQYHRADTLIRVLVWGGVAVALLGIPVELLGTLSAELAFLPALAFWFFLLVPLSVAGILFSIRILEMPDELYGLKQPYAWLNLGASVCYLTLLLIPLGVLLEAGAALLLGLVFLRADDPDHGVDFV